MKRLLFLFILAVAVASAQGDPTGQVTIDGNTAHDLDLISDKGTLLQLQVQPVAPAGETIVDVDFVFSKDSDSFVIREVPSSNGVFTANFAANDVRLDKGSWVLRAKLISSDGQVGFSEPATLEVDAEDAPPLRVGMGVEHILSGTVLDQISVSADAQLPFFINVTTEPQLIQRVIVKNGGLEEIIPAPYVVLLDEFPEGEQVVSILVQDRLGRVATLHQPLLIDRSAPTLDVTLPEVAFVGLDISVELALEDASSVTSIVTLGNQSALSDETQVSHVFSGLEYVEGDEIQGFIFVEDVVGNSVAQSFALPVFKPTAVVTLEVEQSAERVLVGEAVTFSTQISVESPAPEVPLTFSWSNATARTETLFVSSDATHNSVFHFPAGVHTLALNASVPESFNATEIPGSVFEIEVFIGKVVDGDDEYFIRVNENGLPFEAVSNSATFALSLEERDFVDVYELEGTKLFWNPQEKVTETPTESSSSSTVAETEETPFVPIALIGVGLLALRRR